MAPTEYGKFAEVYDLLMVDVPYAAWARYIAGLLAQNDVAPGQSVLDCACGTGEFSIRLHQAGYVVTGSDRSEEMLALAQQKARKAGAKIPFVLQDMRSLALHQPVSAINCACDGVNYLLEDDDVRSFFMSANRALLENGLLLFDISSAYKLEHILGNRTYGEDTKAITYLWQNCFDPDSRLLEMKLAFFLPQAHDLYERFDERHIQRAYSAGELKSTLEVAGFRLEGLYEWPGKAAPAENSERIQFVARKIRQI